MAFPNSPNSSIFTYLGYKTFTAPAPTTEAGFTVLDGFTQIKDIRDFPPTGTESNIITINLFGNKAETQGEGQSTQPSYDLVVAYSEAAHASLDALVQNGVQYIFQGRVFTSEPSDAVLADALDDLASTVVVADRYFVGRFASSNIEYATTDFRIGNYTLSVQSEVFGPYTSTV